MKLIHKFTLWYLVITFFVLIIGGVLSYNTVKKEVDREQARYLKKNIDFTIQELNRGVIPDSLSQNRITIRRLKGAAPVEGFLVSDTLVYHNYLKRMEPQVKVSTVREIGGEYFLITTHGAIVDTDDIASAILASITGIFLIMLVVTGLVSIVISNKILRPFHKTLKAMQSFRLKQKSSLQLRPTGTTEFRKLNDFLEEMTDKARVDYRNLKEFTENASHEIQTPLAIILGKLELLMNSDISAQQAKLIHEAHDAVEKLSKTGQSLTLLSKLNNREFESPELIDFSRVVEECLLSFEELIEMKGIRLERRIDNGIKVNIHPQLVNILLNNLLGNAIRHNIGGGFIRVTLTPDLLEITNPGEPLQGDPEQMFQRFRKNHPNADSVGLGLSIVKQICMQSDIVIHYIHEKGLHTLRLRFDVR